MIKNFNIDRAGTRLRIIRTLLGLKRPEMAAQCGLSAERLRNLEDLKQKLNEDDLATITESWAFTTDYLLHGDPLRLDRDTPQIEAAINAALVSSPELFAQAAKIADILAIEPQGAALYIPEFRNVLHVQLKKLIQEATKKAKSDAR